MKGFHPQACKSATYTVNYGAQGVLLALAALLLSACASNAMTDADTATTPALLQASMKTGYGHGSEVPGQLDDGGWVMNSPGKAHTHKVLLAACPQQPLITHHTHDHLHSAQTVASLGAVAHKHNGCFICPPKNSLVKRITSH